ncbi:MAG: hypothetical protein NTV31_07540 [Bacteroidia bacterium]|nr:hypothetical protein [Bacteroidia bacterium]
MGKNTIKSSCECPATLDELLDVMQDHSGKYKHLQIILKRNNTIRSLGLGQQYLVVNKNGFGVYQLLDINYSNGVIQLKLKDTNTDKIVHTSLNINNKHPQLFLICWKDIKELMFEENMKQISPNDELLELEDD